MSLEGGRGEGRGGEGGREGGDGGRKGGREGKKEGGREGGVTFIHILIVTQQIFTVTSVMVKMVKF